MPGGVFSTAKLHAMTIRESANDGSDFTNPDADYRRLFLGEDGALHLKDSAGTVTDIGGAAGIEVEDEGSSEGTGIEILNFTGAGVSVTVAGAEAEVIIPGGGGGSQSFIGYNTVGGSTTGATGNRVIAKKVTIASAGILTSIDVYLDWTNGNDSVGAIGAAVFADSAGTPTTILASVTPPAASLLLDNTAGGGGNTVPRWYALPIGIYLPAADYWIAFLSNGTQPRLYFDGSGADRRYDSGGYWWADWGFYTPTTMTDRYSLRGSFLTL